MARDVNAEGALQMLGIQIALTAAFAAAFFNTAQAEIVTIDPNNAWHQFDVSLATAQSGGREWIALDDSPLGFAFTTLSGTFLTVVDAGFGGDRFEVFDHGVSLGLTSPGTNTYPRCARVSNRAAARPASPVCKAFCAASRLMPRACAVCWDDVAFAAAVGVALAAGINAPQRKVSAAGRKITEAAGSCEARAPRARLDFSTTFSPFLRMALPR
jgi:hypothetical protein